MNKAVSNEAALFTSFFHPSFFVIQDTFILAQISHIRHFEQFKESFPRPFKYSLYLCSNNKKRHDTESSGFPEYLINLVKNKNYAEDDCFNPLHAAGHPV